MTGRVLVIGDVFTDVLVQSSGPLARGTDTPATIRQMPGGSGANQAVWLATLGINAHFAARVGAADAIRLTRYFEGQGVAAHLAADDAHPTGTLICLIDPDGERSFLTDRGANAHLCAKDLPAALLVGLDWLHISGYALFEPTPRAAILELMAEARAKGIPSSIDPSSTGFLKTVGPRAFLEWADGADLLIPNADEAALLTGSLAPEIQIATLLGHFPRVVFKRGAAGAIFASRDAAPITLPAAHTDVVDTTGAGDAFLAGFLAAQLRGDDAERCLAAAIAAGSRATTQLGAQPR